MSKRQYTWYLRPLDAITNNSLARCISEENFGEYPVDGKNLKMWRCNRETVRQCEASRKNAKLKFEIYVREGNGQIREWKQSRKKRKKKTS